MNLCYRVMHNKASNIAALDCSNSNISSSLIRDLAVKTDNKISRLADSNNIQPTTITTINVHRFMVSREAIRVIKDLITVSKVTVLENARIITKLGYQLISIMQIALTLIPAIGVTKQRRTQTKIDQANHHKMASRGSTTNSKPAQAVVQIEANPTPHTGGGSASHPLHSKHLHKHLQIDFQNMPVHFTSIMRKLLIPLNAFHVKTQIVTERIVQM